MRVWMVVLGLLTAAALTAQTPQTRFTYEDRAGTTGHTLVLDNRTFGPYKEISSTHYSTSMTTALFLTTRRDKTYIVAAGKETGPIAPGFEVNQAWISDDGKVWAVVAAHSSEAEEDDESDQKVENQLWVNGKLLGTYPNVFAFDYAETGGTWIASVGLPDDQHDIILNGKSLGPFSSVDHTWMSPDGKFWGYAAAKDEGDTDVVTQEATYRGVQSTNFYQMYPRSAHWGYAVRIGDEEELIVVDGKSYTGYLNFADLVTTPSGRHWGFQAEKLSDSGDLPVLVINGKEYVGEELGTMTLSGKEGFTWTVRDGSKVSSQLLLLP